MKILIIMCIVSLLFLAGCESVDKQKQIDCIISHCGEEKNITCENEFLDNRAISLSLYCYEMSGGRS